MPLEIKEKHDSFNIPHTLSYSYIALQEAFLATQFPMLYWQTACLLVNSGAIASYGVENSKNASTKYGKIAKAIGELQAEGVNIDLPDINLSDKGFKPDIERGTILFGIKGIARIGDALIDSIIENRPYVSLDDFVAKNKVNITQIINLIKCGAFDNLLGADRRTILKNFLLGRADQKKKLTLANVNMLSSFNLIPEKYNFQEKLFHFNKYIKAHSKSTQSQYALDEMAAEFFLENYSAESCVISTEDDVKLFIYKNEWDKVYKKDMSPLRDFLKNNQEMLDKLNRQLAGDIYEKYDLDAPYSKWEMSVLGFYYHQHELDDIDTYPYKAADFSELPEDPEIENVYQNPRTKNTYVNYKLCNIIGTVLDKDKTRKTVTILTPTGVVEVKLYRSQFSQFDKQVSVVNADGKKTVIEKSWFTRGNLLFFQGMRRGELFIPKAYTRSPLKKPIKKIHLENNKMHLIHDRMVGEEAESEDDV